MEFRIDPFEGGEVEIVHPRFRDETAQEVGHHLRVAEQEVVAAVVIHGRSFDAPAMAVNGKHRPSGVAASFGKPLMPRVSTVAPVLLKDHT